MSKFRKAPDGQPTESIELYLAHAKSGVTEWTREVAFLQSRLRTATDRVATEMHNVAQYEWQLEQRKDRA